MPALFYLNKEPIMFLNKEILADKRDVEQEYTLHLFEKCNLSCSFCWQDHKAFEGVDTVLEKVKPITELLEKEEKKKVVFNIMGGEVFDDSIFDEKLALDYFNLCFKVFGIAKDLGIHARFSFVSNLVTVQLDKVLLLLKSLRDFGIDASVCTSYDMKGRFNKEQKTLWKKNLSKLIELNEMSCVNMLFTKPVIKQLMSKGDDIFEWLYKEGVEIYIDYYTPTGGDASNPALLQANAPSDVDLLKAFVFLVDKYPDVQPIKGMIERRSTNLSCRSSKLVLADGTKCMCGNLHLQDTAAITFYKSPIKPNDNNAIETRFMEERDCLSCEHFSYCQMGCFMQHDFSKRTQLKDCLFRLTYDYIINRVPIDYTQLNTYFGVENLD